MTPADPPLRLACSGGGRPSSAGDTITLMPRWLRTMTVGCVVVCGAMQTAARAQSAEDLVSRNLTAKGGVARLKAVPGLRIMARVLLPTAGLEFPAVITTKRPNRFYQESTIRGQKVIAGFDGEKVTSKDGLIEYFFVDDETGLEAKTVKQIKDGDAITTVETRYANYQAVDGVMLPHILEQKAAGQVLQVTIERVEIAPPVDDTLFKMPAPPQTAAQSPKQ